MRSDRWEPRQAPGGRLPVLAVSMGDPLGIGPEVLLQALATQRLRGKAQVRIYGCNNTLLQAAQVCGVEPFWHRVSSESSRAAGAALPDVVVVDEPAEGLPSRPAPSAAGGAASLRWLASALAACGRSVHAGGADALVTAPVCKESWQMSGVTAFPGHTEWLQARTHSRRAVMMFESARVRVVLATVHEPLSTVPGSLSIGRVLDAIDLGHQACQRLGMAAPRIAVCGLNPHAGEHGLLGHEEQTVVAPAIRMAVAHGIDARGPYPADSLFTARNLGRFDLFVAMYHDQGLIPVKLLDFDGAVNTTLGLPVVRTSPDHGTAFDLVGTGRADPGSMLAALELALKLVTACPEGGQ